MNANDMVYNEVYKGCLKAGCIESIARDAAINTLQKFKNNQFTSPSKLITQSIADAKKITVKKGKKKR